MPITPGVNEFLPFATGTTPNVEDQLTYQSEPERQSGYMTGTAVSAKMNKTWRQPSVMAHCIAQMLANRGENVVDNADLTTLILQLTKHLTFEVGTKMLFVQAAAPLGWTRLTTHDNKALRIVSGDAGAGSGGTLAFTAAFAARGVAGSNIGSANVSGTTDGHVLTSAELPTHNHAVTINDPGHQHVINVNDPGHNHTFAGGYPPGGGGGTGGGDLNVSTNSTTSTKTTGITASSNPVVTGISADTASVGTGAAHTHAFNAGNHLHTLTPGGIDMSVQYVDAIIAQKD